MAYYIHILCMLLLYTSFIVTSPQPTKSNDAQNPPDTPRLVAAQILMAAQNPPSSQSQLPLTAAMLQEVTQTGRWKYAIEFTPDSINFIFFPQGRTQNH